MNINSELGAGIVLIAVGIALIQLRGVLSHYLLGLYQKIGVAVPEEKYAKQFVLVGVILMILGFLMATGLIQYL
ncbi:MAG: hypothetical protein GY703_03420 [Gammaproteobacteria bacterium]|nr:hypothetical protein [Gammaproteobacteria bacterium]